MPSADYPGIASEGHTRPFRWPSLITAHVAALATGWLSYLGMNIDQSHTMHISVEKKGYLTSVFVKWMPQAANKTSAGTPDQLSKAEALKYLSLIMLLMYLARFTKPDILFALRGLATRPIAPSVSNMGGTKAIQLRVSRKATLVPSIFANASHCVHPT